MYKTLLLGLLPLFAACGKTDTGTPEDTTETGTDCPSDPLPLAFQDGGIAITLSGAALGTWDFDVMLDGWASGVQMDTHQDDGGAWDEFFTFENLANDPCGQWDEWGKTLTDSDALGDYTDDGDITLNDPTDAHFALMTFMFTAFGYENAEDQVCVVAGADTGYYLNQGYACDVIDL